MAEISSTRPATAPPAAPRPVVAAAEMALKLLQPMDGLLAAGETAKAEVMAVREQSQGFQMLLKLTLDSGREATLQTSAGKPLELGTAVAVTALSQNRLLAALQPAGGGRPLTALDLDQFPIGTLLQAKVVAMQPVAQARGEQALYQVVVSLLNSPTHGLQAPQSGTRLSLETPLQLPVGSLLTAQIKGPQSLAFLPPSSRLDQLEVVQQLGTQQTRQASMEGLFKALGSLQTRSGLPEGVRMAMQQLLGAVPDATQLTTVKGLTQALLNSGQFTEGRLLGGQGDSLPLDLKANLLRLVAQTLPLTSTGLIPTSAHGGMLAQALPALLRDVLGQPGGQAPRNPGLHFPLPARLLQNMDSEVDLELLLKLAAAAVSRLQTHQLSSLAQSQTGPDGNLLTTWQLELPMRHQQELVPLQMKIQSDQKPPNPERKEKAETIWRVELAFNIDPLGPLQVQAQLAQGSISGQLWAEHAPTAALISHELGHLRERLAASGLVVSELACRQGTPPQGQKTHVEQRWVDEKA